MELTELLSAVENVVGAEGSDGRCTADQLAEKFDVSAQTVRKHIKAHMEALNAAGFVYKNGRKGGLCRVVSESESAPEVTSDSKPDDTKAA